MTIRSPRFSVRSCCGFPDFAAFDVGIEWPSHCSSTPELVRLQAHLSAPMTYRTAARSVALPTIGIRPFFDFFSNS